MESFTFTITGTLRAREESKLAFEKATIGAKQCT